MSVDALNDPALSLPRTEPRDWLKVCNEKHQFHMRLVGQNGWLKSLLARADEMKNQHEAAMQQMLDEMFRPVEKPVKKTAPTRKRGK